MMLSRVAPSDVLNLDITPVAKRPFDHVLVEGFIADDVYGELCRSFPVCPPRIGPTGYSCYWGDPEYDALVDTNSAWRALFDATHSQAFMSYCLTQFHDVFNSGQCTIDIDRAEFVSYQETRANKERRNIEDVKLAPHQLWVRTDIHQAHVGYFRVPHLDHRRRLISMLIYLCDGDDNEMIGGDLVLHRKKQSWLRWGDVSVRPKHNRMVAFPCHPGSWHSVPVVTSQSAPRNYLQITLSSSVDAWPS
jgi:hypothetical protein